MNRSNRFTSEPGLAAVLMVMGMASTGNASVGGVDPFYVGVEVRPTIASGTYFGLPNPNHNRLTLLLSHVYPDDPASSHFHRIGAYSLTGPVASPTVVPTSSGNNVPETHTGWRLGLLPGTGAMAGRYVSGLDDGTDAFQEYGHIELRPIDVLADKAGSDNSLAQGLYDAPSSTPYKSVFMDGRTIAIELVAKSAGLEVKVDDDLTAFDAVGDRQVLDVNDDWSFAPVFHADGSIAAGTDLSATFKLVDLTAGPGQGDSGTFNFLFTTAVPEPTVAVGLGLAGVLFRRRRVVTV